eukprot:TRINITY_DN8821_c0_g2_i2.p2 TRINITY_DN8821_c0_g2~~TRINITY_DN8821_c0_g2_i2.p2  ORF type:complete len:115 (-),score=21.78 TRINITY_DN8821_c0_g2_i2:194-538(-)
MDLQIADRQHVVAISFGCNPAGVGGCLRAAWEEIAALADGSRPVLRLIQRDELESCREKEKNVLRLASARTGAGWRAWNSQCADCADTLPTMSWPLATRRVSVQSAWRLSSPSR